MMRKLLLTHILLFFCVLTQAATFQSNGTGGGGWNAGGTWNLIAGVDGDNMPDSDDDVTIQAGDNVVYSATHYINSVTINGTLTANSTGLLYVSGNYTNNGIETGTGSVSFIGTVNSTISGPGTFGTSVKYSFSRNKIIGAGTTINKTVSTSIGSNVTITNNGTVLLSAVTSVSTSRWTNAANSALTIRNSGFLSTGTLTASALNNTVTIAYPTGAIPTATQFYNLSITGSGVKTATINLNVDNDLSIGTSSTLNMNNNSTYIEGDIVNSGNGMTNTDTVMLQGSVVQLISGNMLTISRLAINGAGASLSQNITVSNELIFLQGLITTNARRVILSSAAVQTGAGQATGWVNGTLQAGFATGATSKRLEIGNASTYLPATLAFGNITTAGNITGSVSSSEHANIATSCIDDTKSVNHYWTLANSGVVFNNYSATFQYTASSYDAGADPANFFVARFATGTWTTLAQGTNTATSTQATGITAFGDFAIGELKSPTVQVQPTDVTLSCAGSTVNFTATVVGGLSTTYQWIENQGSGFSNITDGGIYSGATTNTLTLTGVTAAMGGYDYALLVSHACGTTISTDTVELFVYPSGGWNGSVSTDWHTAANWCGGVPTATTDATIYSVANQPILSAAGVTRNLMINLGATVDLNGQTLSIGGQLSGDGFIKGSNSSNLSFTGSSVFSTLLMDQTSSTTRTINDLTINIPSGGVTMGNAIEIGGVLTITDGNYHSNGQSITLLSTSSGTSRIAPVGATGSMSGTSFNIQRYLSARDSGYVEMSSTVQSTTISDWDQELDMYGINGNEGNPTSYTFTVYGYDETAWDYQPISSSAHALTPGEGFFVFLFDAPAADFTGATAVSTGTPNFGGVTFPITRNNDGWNFVGNPYHSFVSWAAIKAANPTLSASFQSYDDAINDFQTFNAGEIPPGHGFWVETSASTTLSLPESIKTTSTGSQFGRLASHNALQIKLSDNFSKSSHIVKLVTDKSASSNYDFNKDASFIQQKSKHFPSFYAMTGDNKKVVLNTIGTSNEEEIIPLVVNATETGVYTFEFSGMNKMEGYSHIYFQDTENNELYDLNKVGTVNASVEKNQGTSRFRIILSRKAITPAETPSENILLSRTENGANLIMSKGTDAPSIISVYNTLGQEVIQPVTVIGNTLNMNFELPVKGQYYFVKVQTENGTSTRKLFY